VETWKEFEANELTHSSAHHLVAIHDLGAAYGGWARVSDIARSLGITRGSVSINLRSLKKRNLVVTDEHRMVKLSPAGERIVESVVARKTAVKAFLCEVLGLSEEQAEIDSCKIEHLVSHHMSERLVDFMRFLVSDEAAGRDVLERFRRFEDHCPDTRRCAVCKDHCLRAGLENASTPTGVS
jgi:DtxR family transcriptional regulator, Mn-dependent transcriptional regulator